MEDKTDHFRTFCLAIILFLVTVSPLDAKIPEKVLKQKNSVVSVQVEDKSGQRIASGSGFIIDQSGVIVTNCQVISAWLKDMESSLVATTGDGTRMLMEEVISHDCRKGIVLARMESGELPAANLHGGYKIKQGEKIVIMGSRSGSAITALEGTVKGALGKDEIFQTTVPVTTSGSGGPIFNLDGEVIGVAISSEKKRQKINVAIPILSVERQLAAYRQLRARIEAGLAPEAPLPPGISEKMAKLIEQARQQLAEHPDDVEAYLQLARAYSELRRYGDAIEAYLQAIKFSPDNGDAYDSLGLAYYKLGRYQEAIEAYKESVRMKPDSEPGYNRLGTIYIIIGEYTMALDAFKEALRIDPGNSVTHFNLGLSYFLAGDTSAASEEYTLLKELDKKRAAILYDLIYH